MSPALTAIGDESPSTWLDLSEKQHVNVDSYIAVTDTEGQAIGHLIELSMTGMGVIGRAPIALGRRSALRLIVEAHEGSNREYIDVEVEAVWCQERKAGGVYHIGFAFFPLSAKSRLRLTRLWGDFR